MILLHPKLSIINKLFKNNKFKSIIILFSASRNFKIKYKNYDVWPTILTSCILLRDIISKNFRSC